ncbi:MAG: pyroglutamyl-peptidase I [Verrucomicrobiota bacterium]
MPPVPSPASFRPTNPVLLLTGFEPFGGASTNPSREIARAMDGTMVAGHRILGAVLPCVFGGARRELTRLLRRHRPVVVVCLGVAAGRAGITPERVAINLEDARIPDNAGAQPWDRPVVRGGPAAYWSTLPVKAIVAALERHGIPAAVSHTAGTFVCNHLFYALMHAVRRRRVRAGFIHVPAAVARPGPRSPGLPLATQIRGVALALDVAARRRRDLRRAGGSEH